MTRARAGKMLITYGANFNYFVQQYFLFPLVELSKIKVRWVVSLGQLADLSS